jgi:hypothetical protein
MSRIYRVPVQYTEFKIGYMDIEAEDEFAAVDKVIRMDRYELFDDSRFDGSCGDEWNVEVLHEDEIEDITPPTVSEGLWT